MFLYNFSVTDYEERYECDFKWVPPVNEDHYNPPTKQQFIKIVMGEAIKLYNEGKHMFFGSTVDRNDANSFQQFLRWEFYDIIKAVGDNTDFKIFYNEYIADVMFSGVEEDDFIKSMKSFKIDIPPMAGKLPLRKSTNVYN